MVPNGETFGTINVDALREATVGSEKKKKRLFVLLWCRGANKTFLYNIVILYFYQRNFWKFRGALTPPPSLSEGLGPPLPLPLIHRNVPLSHLSLSLSLSLNLKAFSQKMIFSIYYYTKSCSIGFVIIVYKISMNIFYLFIQFNAIDPFPTCNLLLSFFPLFIYLFLWTKFNYKIGCSLYLISFYQR